ncbi:MAG: hypothetical protein ABI551_09515 [Polyangiaceae bacterium]
MQRGIASLVLVALVPAFVTAFVLGACDDKPAVVAVDAGAAVTATPTGTASSGADAAAASPYPMPERPVPKTSPTVGIYAPLETQQKTISYMAAMAAPHPDDPFVDEAYVKSLVDKLKPVVASMDRGPDKAKAEHIDIIGGGRRIDLTFSLGCEAETPGHVIGSTGVTLGTLHDHGVLVVACHDSRAQCLQSTRDPTDILCTQAPKHNGH